MIELRFFVAKNYYINYKGGVKKVIKTFYM